MCKCTSGSKRKTELYITKLCITKENIASHRVSGHPHSSGIPNSGAALSRPSPNALPGVRLDTPDCPEDKRPGADDTADHPTPKLQLQELRKPVSGCGSAEGSARQHRIGNNGGGSLNSVSDRISALRQPFHHASQCSVGAQTAFLSSFGLSLGDVFLHLAENYWTHGQ